MTSHQLTSAAACLAASHDDAMTFPNIVETLIRAGFDGYTVDFRQNTATYYLPEGEGVVLPLLLDQSGPAVAPDFDGGQVKDAIREAQSGSAGYTYKGFCRKVKTAGCAGYMVSFSGRRVVYFGRSAEFHTEHFPQ